MTPDTPQARIGHGVVRHTRLRPASNAFAYRVFFVLLPMRALARHPESAVLPRNARGLVAFHDADHGDGRGDSLQWVEALLHGEGIDDIDGEIWLQTFPRVLGYVFNPVSFWYCHRADGGLAAVVVEVNNTFGERHCYLLLPTAGRRTIRWGQELHARKVFHVSPFCQLEGRYRFRFLRSNSAQREHIVARIDHDDADGPLLLTSIDGALEPLTRTALRRAFVIHPLHSFGVMARIHWQALRLWLKRVPFVTKPMSSNVQVTR